MLEVRLDKASGVPMYVQLEEQIRLMIRSGTLQQGAVLPTVRSLAVTLSVNANTVARVYRDLQRDGLLRLERGVGTFVSGAPAEPILPREFKKLERRVEAVILLAKQMQLTAVELSQLIETRWKEVEHDEG